LDVFVNVAGGLRVMEPSVDLGIVLAMVSSAKDQAMPPQTVVMGEVGLGGEVRAVSQLERRVYEAERLGFQRVIPHAADLEKFSTRLTMESVDTIQEAIGRCFSA